MRYRISGPEVIHERMDDEVVVIHLETGAYYSLNRSGSDFWAVLSTGSSVDEAVSLFATRYSTSRDILRDAVQGLVARLLEEKLLVADSSQQPGQSAVASVVSEHGSEAMPFIRPVLQRYTDMQALLLQDPIHEVDATGWPAPKTPGTPG